MSAPIQSDYVPDSPYPGIDPFGYRDRNVFFARAAEIRSLLRLVVLYRGVLLYADSGTGKSSLVNAGILPCALAEDFQPERIRVQPRRGEEFVVQISEKVGNDRISYPSIFTSDRNSERVVLSVEEFEARLRQHAGEVRPVLVFDQFEEWVTLFEKTGGEDAAKNAKESQEKIQNAICSIINDGQLPVKVLLSLREDYLARLTPFFRQCPHLPDHYLRLVPLKGEQIFQAIRGPFEKYPRRFAPQLSEALAKKIQEEFEGRSGGTDIRLTEVQIVCRTLYEAREEDPAAVFERARGVQGILEGYLEQAVESLGKEQREPAIALLSRMVTAAGTRDVISQDNLCWRVTNEDGIARDLLDETLNSLEQKAKLIRRERRREVYYYEIASEFLVGWIRKKALERQSESEQRKKLEAQLLAEREERAQEREKQAKKFLVLTWVLGALLLVAVVAIVVGQIYASRAQSRELVSDSILSEPSDPELSILLAANAVAKTWPWFRQVLPEAENQLRVAVMAVPPHTILRGHESSVTSVAWSPDGQRLATASEDHKAKVWDAATRKELLTLSGRGGPVMSVAWSPNGKQLATGSVDKTARVWDAATGKELLTLRGHGGPVMSVAWSPDGKRLATASEDHKARVWDAETGEELLTLSGHTDSVSSVAWSRDGRLATASWDGTAKVWDAASGEVLLTLSEELPTSEGQKKRKGSPNPKHPGTGHGSRPRGSDVDSHARNPQSYPVLSVAWSRDGERLATASGNNTAKIWDAQRGEQLQNLVGHTGAVNSVAWSPDGERVATGSQDETAKVWDTRTGEQLFTLHDHGTGGEGQGRTGISKGPQETPRDIRKRQFSGVISVAWGSGDGKRLATASQNHTATVWDVEPKKELLTLGRRTLLSSVAWSRDGKRLATASQGQTALVSDAEVKNELQTLSGHGRPANSGARSSDSAGLAPASQEQTAATIWDAETGTELFALTGHRGPVSSVAWSSDGERLATTSADNTAKVWDAATRKELLTLSSHGGPVVSVAWSPDGKQLVTGSVDNTAKVWDAATGKELLTLRGHGGPVVSVAWSPDPDGKRLATASVDNTAKVWDAKTGKELRTLFGHKGVVNSVAWSPDGQRLATASVDNTAKVWDAKTGYELLTLGGHNQGVLGVAWSPDGKRLATASTDGTVQVYVMDIRDLMELARQRLTAHASEEGCKKYPHVPKCLPVPELSRWL